MGFFGGSMGEWPHQPPHHLQHGSLLFPPAHSGHEDSQYCLKKNETIILRPHPQWNKQISWSHSFLIFSTTDFHFYSLCSKFSTALYIVKWSLKCGVELPTPPPPNLTKNPFSFLSFHSLPYSYWIYSLPLTKRTNCSILLRSSDVARLMVSPLSHKMHSFSWLSTLTTN